MASLGCFFSQIFFLFFCGWVLYLAQIKRTAFYYEKEICIAWPQLAHVQFSYCRYYCITCSQP